MSACNIEKMVMEYNNDKLIKGLRQAKDSICRELCSKSLLSYNVRQDCLEGKPGIDFIISALQDRIANDSEAYYEFLNVLKNDPGLKYLVDILESHRKAMEEKTSKELINAESECYFPKSTVSDKRKVSTNVPMEIPYKSSITTKKEKEGGGDSQPTDLSLTFDRFSVPKRA